MPLRDECADEECGHGPEAHYEETRSTWQVDRSFILVRTVCTMARCECRSYVPPEHLRKR